MVTEASGLTHLQAMSSHLPAPTSSHSPATVHAMSLLLQGTNMRLTNKPRLTSGLQLSCWPPSPSFCQAQCRPLLSSVVNDRPRPTHATLASNDKQEPIKSAYTDHAHHGRRLACRALGEQLDKHYKVSIYKLYKFQR
jgi:hypothetical protein